MSNLVYFENIIKEKRKKTPFNDFLRELGSGNPIMFYKNKGLIAKYPVSDRINVISLQEYNDQRDGFCDYGKEFVENKNFFEQFKELYITVPMSNVLHVGNNENCEYCETAVHTKNAYLSSIVSHGSENVFYSDVVRENCRNVFNSCYVQHNSENIYTCLGIETSFKIFYSRFINNCNNIWFSTNLIGCSECIFCDNLENKKYCISNKELNKDEYLKQKQEILSKKLDFLSWYKNLLNTNGNNYNSKNVKGSFVIESENVENGFIFKRVKNARNVILAGSMEISSEIYDYFLGGAVKNNIVGVSNAGSWSEYVYLSVGIGFSNNIYYSIGLDSCSFCFGCLGLKNKSFCILNKQYSKEEWYLKVEKIFIKMEKDGIIGEFFPGYINPFYFNDTFGGLLLKNAKKEDILKEGYLWRNNEIKTDIPEGAETVETKNLLSLQGYNSNGNWQINPEILKKIIIDENKNIYKIIPEELELLQKYALPIPNIHWVDRRKLHFNF